MLKLHSDTDESWVRVAVANLDAILLDHVHCEKKAAVMAISLINRYPDRTRLVDAMAALAREEMEHFIRVLAIAQARGGALERDRGDPYVQQLMLPLHRQEPRRLLDALLCAALIEARSCERFTRLVAALPDGGIKDIYEELIPVEAGHFALFLSLAREYFPRTEVDARFEELAAHEAEVCAGLRNEPKVHG
jgi:tRNA 2-(methylsulfanyl)-N6-isopentenyladenosine37 hydroxylase